MSDLRVLVVEDDLIAAEAHRTFVDRVPGFRCAGVVGSCGAALRRLAELRAHPVDLLLLDLHLPDGHGLDLVRRIRAAGDRTDVIAVTSAREAEAVRAAARGGVLQYVLKPFAYDTLRERLLAYARYRKQLAGGGEVRGQQDADRYFGALDAPPATESQVIPAHALERVVALVGDRAGWTAQEVADRLGSSRVTARRYLEHLADHNQLLRSQRHDGRSGRPSVEYTWIADGTAPPDDTES